jgi:hypothetical protein
MPLHRLCSVGCRGGWNVWNSLKCFTLRAIIFNVPSFMKRDIAKKGSVLLLQKEHQRISKYLWKLWVHYAIRILCSTRRIVQGGGCQNFSFAGAPRHRFALYTTSWRGGFFWYHANRNTKRNKRKTKSSHKQIFLTYQNKQGNFLPYTW